MLRAAFFSSGPRPDDRAGQHRGNLLLVRIAGSIAALRLFQIHGPAKGLPASQINFRRFVALPVPGDTILVQYNDRDTISF